jgi:hypothetical protein
MAVFASGEAAVDRLPPCAAWPADAWLVTELATPVTISALGDPGHTA